MSPQGHVSHKSTSSSSASGDPFEELEKVQSIGGHTVASSHHSSAAETAAEEEAKDVVPELAIFGKPNPSGEVVETLKDPDDSMSDFDGGMVTILIDTPLESGQISTHSQTTRASDESLTRHTTDDDTHYTEVKFPPAPAKTVMVVPPTTGGTVKDRRFWMCILSVLLATFLGAMDLASIPTLLPTLASDLHATTYQWVSNSFTLTSVAFIPVAASLAGIFGRKPPMIGALILFTAGTAICAAAQNMNTVIVGRSVQGAGAGALLALCQIVIADLTSLAERNVLGSFCPGAFSAKNTWRGFFYLQLPFCGLALILVTLFLNVKAPQTTLSQKWKMMDPANIVFIGASTAFILGLSFGGSTFSWSSWRTIVPLVIGAVGLGVWLWLETLVSHPTLPIQAVKDKNALLGYIVCLLQAYFQSSKGSSSIRAAVQSLSLSISIPLLAIFTGGYIKKTHDYVNPLRVGWVVMILGSGLMVLMKADSPAAIWIIMPTIQGCAQGILATSPQFAVLSPLPPAFQPHASGFYILVRTFGQMIGTVLGNTIYQNELLKKAPAAFLDYFPSVQEAGFTGIATVDHLQEPFKSSVQAAYADSIAVIWMVSIGLGAAGLIATMFITKVALTAETTNEFGVDRAENEKRE
ncbi:MFS multidrug transporter [Pseudohyphozyma bogoriensis]|nr:MFS multidrug transporter [Pseudohyphozyma bogoriensis]